MGFVAVAVAEVSFILLFTVFGGVRCYDILG